MRFTRLAVALPLVALTGCGSSSTSHLLVLDRSAGPVRLREPRSQVEHELGRGTILPPRRGVERVFYPRQYMTIWYYGKAPDSPVEVVQITSPRYRTKGGVGVGTGYAKLQAVPGVNCYSGNGCQLVHAHNQPGTVFRMEGPNGAVSEILLLAAVD
jgi:hypothetical protein